jgi:RNase P/RNase MRP subunit p29
MQRFYRGSRSFEGIRGQVIRPGKKTLKEEKEQIDQEQIKA